MRVWVWVCLEASESAAGLLVRGVPGPHTRGRLSSTEKAIQREKEKERERKID